MASTPEKLTVSLARKAGVVLRVPRLTAVWTAWVAAPVVRWAVITPKYVPEAAATWIDPTGVEKLSMQLKVAVRPPAVSSVSSVALTSRVMSKESAVCGSPGAPLVPLAPFVPLTPSLPAGPPAPSLPGAPLAPSLPAGPLAPIAPWTFQLIFFSPLLHFAFAETMRIVPFFFWHA